MISSTLAATVYVSDIQFVAIREGQNNNSRAVERGLKSGTPLQIMQQAEGYTQVQPPAGNIGWIADYFLRDDKVSRDQLIELQTQITQLAEIKISLQDELANSVNLANTLKVDVTTLATEKARLEAHLAELNELTTEAQEIVKNNNDNVFAIQSLQQRLQSSEAKTLALQKSHEQKWFIIGAGTLLSGLLVGIIIPMTRRKKQNTGAWV